MAGHFGSCGKRNVRVEGCFRCAASVAIGHCGLGNRSSELLRWYKGLISGPQEEAGRTKLWAAAGSEGARKVQPRLRTVGHLLSCSVDYTQANWKFVPGFTLLWTSRFVKRSGHTAESRKLVSRLLVRLLWPCRMSVIHKLAGRLFHRGGPCLGDMSGGEGTHHRPQEELEACHSSELPFWNLTEHGVMGGAVFHAVSHLCSQSQQKCSCLKHNLCVFFFS